MTNLRFLFLWGEKKKKEFQKAGTRVQNSVENEWERYYALLIREKKH